MNIDPAILQPVVEPEREILKISILLLLTVLGAPLLAFAMLTRPFLVKIVFFAMCFMTIRGFFEKAEWGLTPFSDDLYRGHARGFHVYYNEILALSLILYRALQNFGKFKLLPPGFWLYLVFCSLSCLSIVNAVRVDYFFYAAWIAFKASLIFLAVYNYVRSEREIRFFLMCMVFTILWQFGVVLWMKYVDGMHQVKGTFEHQNPLAMYVNLIGMVLLAAGTSANDRRANWCLGAYFACAIIVIFTLSRAGLVIFVAGSAMIMALSFWFKMTKRKFKVMAIMAVCGVIGFGMTIDSIIERFNDPYTQDSGQTRRMLRKASIMMLKDYPLGVGWNNYGIRINHPYKYGDHIDDYYIMWGEGVDKTAKKGIEESHYYLLLAETGYQGFFSYLIFIGVFLWFNFKGILYFKHAFLGSISLGILTGCLVNYVQSFLERVLTQPRNMMLWMMLLAITAKIEFWRRIAKDARRRRTIKLRKMQKQGLLAAPAPAQLPEPEPVYAYTYKN